MVESLFSGGGLTVVRATSLPAGPSGTIVTATNVLGLHLGPPTRVIQERDGLRRQLTYVGGDLTSIPQGCAANCTTDSSASFAHVHLAKEFVARALPEREPEALPVLFRFRDPLAGALLESVAHESAREGRAARAYVESAAVTLLLRLRTRHTELNPRLGLAPAALRRVLDRMHAELDTDLSVVELARMTGLSTDHFARMFKRTTGLPPHRYLGELRLERAKALLVETQSTVLEIAAQVGFDSPSHFASFFSRRTGMTPARYRALRRQ